MTVLYGLLLFLLLRSQSSYGFSSKTPDRRAFLDTIVSGAATPFLWFDGSVAASNDNTSDMFEVGGKPQFGDESIMNPKAHGTSEYPVQQSLKYSVSNKLADKICNFNRHFAEFGGYFESTPFEEEMRKASGPVVFYDSVTGKPLFKAPINRSLDEFLAESKSHGWPSFRDSEVVWSNVRILRNSGETVSVDGTHLGHNLPDRKGNRYCINLVSIAGSPKL